MNFCREAFASFKTRIEQLIFPSSDPLPEASSAGDSESGLSEHSQPEQQNEPIPVPPQVRVGLPQNLDWPLVLIGFCLASAVDIALHSVQTNAKIPLFLQFLAFCILLAFVSLLVARFVTFRDTMLPQVLEKSGMFFAVTAFFIALTTCFHLFLKLISWTIYVLSLLAIIICRSP